MLNSRAWLSRYLPILSKMSSQEDLEVAREQVAEQVVADPERELGIMGSGSSPNIPKVPSESSINDAGDLDIEIAPESPAPSSSSSSPAFIPPRISRRHSEASLLIGTTSKRQLNVPQDTHIVGSVNDHLSLIDEWDEVHGSAWNWKNHSDSSDDGDVSEEHKKWELDSKEEESHPFARYDDLSNMSYGGIDSILDSPQKQAPPPVNHSKFESKSVNLSLIRLNWLSQRSLCCLDHPNDILTAYFKICSIS